VSADGEKPQLFPVLWGLWAFYLLRAEHQTACELGEHLFRLAQSAQDSALLIEACHALGHTRYVLGEFAPARELFEQGLALYDPQQHRFLAFRYGQDSGVVCLGLTAFALWMLGYPDQALKRLHEALTLARDLSHPFSLATTLWGAGILHQLRGEEKAVQERAEAIITLAAEQGFPLYLAGGTILRGWALAEQGQVEEGITHLCQGLAAWRTAGTGLWQPYFLAQLAAAHGKGKQVEEGLVMLAEALAVGGKTKECSDEAELYRLKGQLTLQEANQKSKGKSQKSKVETSPQPLALNPQAEAEAEECFWKAIEIAQKQQAKSLELRAVMSLARLWQQQGKHREAHTMLSAIYNWFTEGFDTKDLQEAKALLDSLASRV
jgi:predicted ATPase